MKKNLFFVAVVLVYVSLLAGIFYTPNRYIRHEVKLFFGLSIPSGGTVSAADWDSFQKNEIASVFDGFNVVDSTGIYKGVAEPSKIVTFIVKGKDLGKIRKIARTYALRFHQDSVMVLDDSLLKQELIVE